MVRHTFLLAALASVAMGLSCAGQVRAAVGPHQSDNNLRFARYRIEENVDLLQRDRHDYNGYRVRAIASFQAAREQIDQALRYDRQADWNAISPLAASSSYPDNRSDRNLLLVRGNIEHLIDMLQRDNHDYGGHRVSAIGFLQQGRTDLTLALRYDGRH